MGKGNKPYQNDGSKFDNNLESYSRGLYDLRDDVSEELPKSNVIAKHMPLSKIIPDLLQPRHLVPAAARSGWDGTPEGIPAMLVDWHEMVEGRLGRSLDARQFIQSETDELPDITVPDPDNPNKRVVDPVALGYTKTLQLAGSILKDGQRNPTSVYRSRGLFVVETGERRLMACHLLKLYMGDEHDTVLATKIDQPSIWMQVKENNVREELNAIGQARSLALLVMDMYADEAAFQAYNELVQPGGSDRAYYAQVADGNEYRIKYGMGADVQEAMGLSSRRMLTAYRNLLKIPDWLWVKADEENWSEFAIRSKMDELEGTNSAGTPQKGQTMLPVGNNVTDDTPPRSTPQTADHSSTLTPDTRPRPPVPQYTNRNFAAGDRVYHTRHGLARIDRVEDHAHVAIRAEDTNSLLRNIHESEIELAAEDAQDTGNATPEDPLTHPPHTPLPRDERPATTPQPVHDIPYNIDDWLALKSKPGRPGKVIHIKDEQNRPIVTVQMADNGEQVSALLGAWQRTTPPSPPPQRTPPAPAAAINDLPPEIAAELRSTIQVLTLMADQHEPTDGIEQVRDALEVLRSGTLEDMTTEQLSQDESLLAGFADYMRDLIHEALANAITELKQRRNS